MPIKVLAVDAECVTVEGEPPGPRTVILEVESEDDFRSWYDSPEYPAILDKRLAATTGFALLAKRSDAGTRGTFAAAAERAR